MKTRRFIVYSLIYIVLVGVFVYSLDASEYTFSFLEYSLTLPLAAWIVIPVAIFAVLAIVHIAYHGFEIYVFKRSLKKDEHHYNELAKEVFLGLDTNKEFKTELYKTPSQTTKILSPWKKYDQIAVSNDELDSVVKIVKGVQNGEVMDLNKFKLPKDNKLFIQNELNKLEKIPNYFVEVVKSYQELNDEISKKANEKLIRLGSFTDIKRYGFEKSGEEVMIMIDRFVNDEIDMNSEEIFEILNHHQITKEQYNHSAIVLKDKLAPDTLIGIFERLRGSHQDAEEAYLYVLFELQMIERIREILENSDPYEYQNFRILLYLRENGRMVPANMLFR